MHNLLTELSKLAALEEDLLAQSRDLLSTVAMLHVSTTLVSLDFISAFPFRMLI